MNPPQVHMYSPSWTLLPPPSPHQPPGSSQCTSPKHPASCIEPGPATRFIHDILHVSMPFSQIFPPSPSPTESIRLFYSSVSLLLSVHRDDGKCCFNSCLQMRKLKHTERLLSVFYKSQQLMNVRTRGYSLFLNLNSVKQLNLTSKHKCTTL